MLRLLGYSGLIFATLLTVVIGILHQLRQYPSTAEWIFFSATPHTQSNLYRYHPSTQELEQLSFGTYPETLVTADPSGRYLYLLTVNEFLGVKGYQVTLNGWHWRKTGAYPQDLTNQYPYQISPDSKWIVTSYLVGDGNAEIFLRDTQSDAMYPLTDTPHTTEIEPAWSPDGQWIVYISNKNMGWGLYRMQADGSQQEELVNLSGTLERPIWLPALNMTWQPRVLILISLLGTLGGISLAGLSWWLQH